MSFEFIDDILFPGLYFICTALWSTAVVYWCLINANTNTRGNVFHYCKLMLNREQIYITSNYISNEVYNF